MRPEDDAHIRFLLRLGRALHCYGYPSPNLEAALTRLADRFGLDSQFFSTPTSINLAFGPLEHQRTFMLRVEPGETNLERMAQLHGVIREVMAGGLTSEEATQRVEEILDQPPRYPRWLQTIAFGLASGGAALFLGEQVRARRIAALLIGFAGVLIVLRPGAIPMTPGIAAAVISAVSTAFSLVAIKQLVGTDDPRLVAAFTFVLMLPTGVKAVVVYVEVPGKVGR